MKCCLLVWAFTTCLQAFAGYWGRCMLFSLSGSMLPAFRPCWILGEMSAVSLSGPLLPAHRPLQDNGGDVCCSPCLGLLLPAFRPCWILGEIRVAQNLPSTRYTNFPHGMKFYGSSIVEKYKKNYSRA